MEQVFLAADVDEIVHSSNDHQLAIDNASKVAGRIEAVGIGDRGPIHIGSERRRTANASVDSAWIQRDRRRGRVLRSLQQLRKLFRGHRPVEVVALEFVAS